MTDTDINQTFTTSSQVAAELERRITTGELEPGARLDPVRAAAQALGLAPNTVANAYKQLANRGLVRGQGRRGTFVAERPALGPPGIEAIPDGIIDLATGNPDPSLLPPLAGSGLGQSVHTMYGASPVDEALAAAVAPALLADLGQRASSLAPDGIEPMKNLAVVSGALDGIERALGAHLRPGDTVAVEDPAYTSVIDLVKAMGLRLAPVAIDGSGPTVDGVADALDAGAAAVILTPRAQNPTGAAVDASRANDLSEVLSRHRNVLIVEDDHAGAVAGAPYRSSIPAGHRSWALIRSMAKSLGPDLRVATLLGDQTTTARVMGRQSVGPGWVSHILQRAAATLSTKPDTIDRLNEAAEHYRQRRQIVVDGLAAQGIEITARSGLNVWLPVDDEARVVTAMLNRGFAVRSGSRFRLRSGPAVRVSTAGAEPSVLADATDALVEVMAGGPPGRSV